MSEFDLPSEDFLLLMGEEQPVHSTAIPMAAPVVKPNKKVLKMQVAQACNEQQDEVAVLRKNRNDLRNKIKKYKQKRRKLLKKMAKCGFECNNISANIKAMEKSIKTKIISNLI